MSANKGSVQTVTTGMSEDIDHIRKEIGVPKSKEDEHETICWFLKMKQNRAIKKSEVS